MKEVIAVIPGCIGAAATGGQARYGAHLLEYLEENGVAVRHVRIYDRGDWRRFMPLFFRAFLAFSRAAIRRNRKQVVVHVFTPVSKLGFLEKALISSAARVFRYPVVLSVRNDLKHLARHCTAFERVMIGYLIKRVSLITGQYSDFPRELMQFFKYPKDRIVVVPNGVKLKEVSRRFQGSGEMECDEVVVGYFGGDSEVKGFPIVLNVLEASLSNTGRRRKYVFILGGRYSPSAGRVIDRLVRDGVRAQVVGFVTEEVLDHWFKRIHVLLMPSQREGFSNLLLEAMQQGVVPVVSPVGGAKDVVIPGVNGFFIERGCRTEDVYCAFDTAFTRFDQLSLLAQKTIRRGYELNAALKRLASTYDDAILLHS